MSLSKTSHFKDTVQKVKNVMEIWSLEMTTKCPYELSVKALCKKAGSN